MITFAVIIAIALAAFGGYALGRKASYRPATESSSVENAPSLAPPASAITAAAETSDPTHASPSSPTIDSESERVGAEKARIIRSRDSEAAMLRAELADRDVRQRESAPEHNERERLVRELTDSRGETARYRQLVIDIENRAPPPILAGVGEPDDLKLIVGIGPVLERMLHGLRITQFRQIARWSERDAADFDAKLPEFPGRIQRDQWITQARELHRSKYGERP